MKIGELFVALGFKVDTTPLDETERRMEGAAVKAGKLALVVNAVNVAMLAMVDSATKAAVSLRLWEQTTGGSTDELQRWGAAAKIVGLEANEMRSAIEKLQDARNAFALGEPQNVGAWQILGVDPTGDPFVVMTKLRARMAQMRDPNLMRGLLGRVGLAGVMPVLQAPAADFERLQRAIMSPRQVDNLVRLNREWQRLLVNLAALKNQLSAALAPGLRALATLLGVVAERLTAFTNWLTSSSTAAGVARFILGALAVAMLALGAAVGIAAGALFVFSPKMLAAGAAILPMIANLAIVAALLAAIVLVVDDVMTAFEGGNSVSGALADWVLGFDAVRKSIEVIWATWDKFIAALKGDNWIKNFLFAMNRLDPEHANDFAEFSEFNKGNRGAAWFSPKTGGASGSWTQENNVEVNVDGAQNPEATGREVGRSIRKELEAAAYQIPVPNY